MSNRTSQEAQIVKICDEINLLLDARESSAWKVGDLLVELSKMKVSGKPLTLTQLREQYLSSYAISYLSQLRSTAIAVPPEEREKYLKRGVTWHECEIARRARSHCVKANVANKDDSLEDYINFANKNKGKKLSPKKMMKDRIEAATEETRKSRALQVEQLKRDYPKWMENCHHASCLDVMDNLPDNSIDLVSIDPPYGAFDKIDDGQFSKPETKGLETECDNKTRKEAVDLTLAIIERAARVLKENGKLVLYQAATIPDRPEVIMFLKEMGFDAVLPMYWKKTISQPGDFSIPFSHETERILVAARTRRALEIKVKGAGRTDLITDEVIAKVIPDTMEYKEMPPSRTFYNEARKDKVKYGDRHFFEKPLGINKFFLEKLTLPGDTVIDVCGCTGSMIQACIEMDRRWIYCESNEINYNLGVSRIGEVMEQVAGIKSKADDASASA